MLSYKAFTPCFVVAVMVCFHIEAVLVEYTQVTLWCIAALLVSIPNSSDIYHFADGLVLVVSGCT